MKLILYFIWSIAKLCLFVYLGIKGLEWIEQDGFWITTKGLFLTGVSVMNLYWIYFELEERLK